MKSLLVGLAIIFCLLMSNVANAQSAWVLWGFQYLGDEQAGNWFVRSAFPNLELCTKELNSNLESLKKAIEAWLRTNVSSFEGGLLVNFRDESGKERRLVFLYKCLPDTIDPRK